jgi:acylphosphatase
MRRLHLIIRGHVQGVCFRLYTRSEAQRLGLTGWVRNRSDGTVELVAEGCEQALEALHAWCRHGPDYAQVSRVDAEMEPVSGEFADFRIAY